MSRHQGGAASGARRRLGRVAPLAVLLVVVLLPAMPAGASGIVFEDARGSVHEPFILAVAGAGITLGCEPDRYCPDEEVTRGQMATFIARALGLEPVLPSGFDDVPDSHTHAGSIGAIAEAGIAGGFGDGTYGPEQNVTRGQMATFIARALGLEPVLPSGFDDVSDDHTHAGSIGAIAAEGIAGGFGDGTYGPERNVTRGQMATFIARAVGLDPVEPLMHDFPPQPTVADVAFDFDVADDVPREDLDNILMGLAVAQAYLGVLAGGDLAADDQEALAVTVVATGDGEPVSGSCCVAGSHEIFIDVEHPHWRVQCSPSDTSCLSSISVNHRKIAAHEYVHVWHGDMGCLHQPEMPFWLKEGIAEWAAFDGMLLIDSPLQLDGRLRDRAGVLEAMIQRARESRALDQPLETLAEGGPDSPWPGEAGYVAVEHLLEPPSVTRTALRTVCTELAAGQSLAAAFEIAFEVEVDEFYARFEKWRQEQLAAG